MSPVFVSMFWKTTRHLIDLSSPRVMGIVNVTPDSFADGGERFDPDRAVTDALRMVEQGADILDIGGESTRPGAPPVDEAVIRYLNYMPPLVLGFPNIIFAIIIAFVFVIIVFV